jgi:pimeloyl-ACP methyl ester carboxylesterase
LPPDTTWSLLPQCGHNALWDDPPAVAAAILDNHSQAPT